MIGDDATTRIGIDAFRGLAPVWRTVFHEAWESWQAGNYGVGAALVDPHDARIVSVGRNRVAQSEPAPGLLSGNMTAHAEMNAFAALDRFNADGLHLYTTLQPCLMCAGSAMLLKVAQVFFAADDEFFDRLDDLWQHHPMTAARAPATWGPFDGERRRLANFARLLPMTFSLTHFPDQSAAAFARQINPSLAALGDQLVAGESIELRRLGTVDDVLEAVWDRLPDD